MNNKASILVVEDEQKIRTALRDFLEFHGFGVTDVVDGLEAEQTVADKQFDLILLDLMLPKISGEQLCKRWRRDGLQTPIIMLTAKGQENERVAGLNIGADDYITKPFSGGRPEFRVCGFGSGYSRPEGETRWQGNRDFQAGGGHNTIFRGQSQPCHQQGRAL